MHKVIYSEMKVVQIQKQILETIIIKLIPPHSSTYSATINHTFFYNLNFTDYMQFYVVHGTWD